MTTGMRSIGLQLSNAALDELADLVASRVADQIGAGLVGMNAQQAAVACGLSVKTLQRAVDAGELVGSRVGSRWVFLRADLETWLRGRRTAPVAGSLRALYAEGRQPTRPRAADTAGGRPRESELHERRSA